VEIPKEVIQAFKVKPTEEGNRDTAFESNEYRYHSDSLKGVGWFERKRDNKVSLLETGSDHDQNMDSFRQLWNQGMSDNRRNTIFNQIARENEFDD